MNVATRKPRIFIGSSVERLDVAYALQELLEYDAEPTVWNQGIFQPSNYVLPDLLTAAESNQFAIFVFAGDDLLVMRDERMRSVRDNVVFELGLFIGALGRQSCFLIVPRDTGSLHLPTDLLGLTPLTYVSSRTDGNLVAALGPASNRIRTVIHRSATNKSSTRVFTVDSLTVSGHDEPGSLETYVVAWQGPELLAAREMIRNWGLFDPHDEDFPKVRPALQRLFAFFESLADAVIAGRIRELEARKVFAEPVKSLWPHLHTSLAPPNHVDEWWDPPPKLAELYGRWTGDIG